MISSPSVIKIGTSSITLPSGELDESALVKEPFFYHKRRTIAEETSVERKKITACASDLRMFF